MRSYDDSPELEARKVQLSGGSTFTVSLPKEWALEHGIDAGSELGLRPNGDGTLLIQVDTTATEDTHRPTVDIDRYDFIPIEVIVRELYLAGYSEFALRGARATNPEGIQAVEAATDSLVGLAVERMHDETLVLRNALNPEYVSLQQTLRQLRRNACEGFEIAVEAVLSENQKEFGAVENRSAETQRQFAIIQRSFRRSLVDHSEVDRLGETKTTLFDYYLTGQGLLRAAREAEQLAEIKQQPSDDQFSEDLRGYLTETTELLMAGTDSVLTTAAPADVAVLFDQREQLREHTTRLKGQLAERKLAYASPVARVQHATERVAQEAETVVAIATQRALRAHEGQPDRK